MKQKWFAQITGIRHSVSAVLFVSFGTVALSSCTEQTPNTFRLKPVEQVSKLTEQKAVSKNITVQVEVPVTEASHTPITESSPTPVTFSSPTPVSYSSPTPISYSSPTPVTYSSPTPVAFSSPTPVTFPSPTVVIDKVRQETKEAVSRPIDILWMVDNSSSMEPSQEKLRKALKGFAQTYLNGSKDVRLGVLTTDAYLAHPAFANFLKSMQPHSVGYKSAYLGGKDRQATFQNPYSDPQFLTKDGVLTHGITMAQLHPLWGPNYAKLLPGIHDGPAPMFCMELPGDFFSGITSCSVRDDQTRNSGPEHCLNPTGSESMISQCVNTVENNSIHSGRAILETIPAGGSKGDAKYYQQLLNDFMVNISVGTTGSGSERGLGSVIQFMRDNEVDGSPSKFFRKGAIHMLVFLSDEDDQTMIIPANPSPTFHPEVGYTHSCPSTQVNGFTYTLSTCIKTPSLALRKVTEIKAEMDAFFAKLDGKADSYFIVPIVAKDGKTIEYLQQQQKKMQGYHNAPTDQDVGRRYIEMANLVNNNNTQLSKALGNGAMIMDIGSDDYSSMLKNMGETITHVSEIAVPRTVIKQEKRIDMKPATRIEMKPQTRIDMKPATRIEMKPATRIEMKAATRIENRDVTRIVNKDVTRIVMKDVTHTETTNQIVPSGPIQLPRVPAGTEKMVVSLCHAGGACENVPSSKFAVDGKTLTVTDQEWLKTVQPTDTVKFQYQPLSASN